LRLGFNKSPGLDVYFAADHALRTGAIRNADFYTVLTTVSHFWLKTEAAVFWRD